MKKVWKEIPDTDGLYQVSNKGQIKRLSFEYEDKLGRKYLKPELLVTINSNGIASITVNGKVRKLTLRTLLPSLFTNEELGKEEFKDLPGEVWRPVKNYEGWYEVSNMGRVRSVDRYVTERNTGKVRFFPGQLLKQKKHKKNAYLRVNLRQNDVKTTFLVHRLVAIAFHPNPTNLPCVNHKDEDPKNNRADNLEWCTEKYNNNYGNHGKKISAGSTRKKAVEQYKDGKLIKRYDSQVEACRELGMAQSSLYYCLKGKYKSCKGFQWKEAS